MPLPPAAVHSTIATPTTPTIAPGSSPIAAPASEANVNRLRVAGYKPETHNSETFYCRRETKMGSLFDTKVCGTAAQLAAATLNGQEMAEISRRQALTTPTGR